MNIGFIPLRKGSKGIPGKNIKKLMGRPLYAWILGEAVKSNLDEIYVYSDDEDLINFINEEYHYTEKVQALIRSSESATDTATTEFAIEEFIKSYKKDLTTFTLLQATSPLTKHTDINKSIQKVLNEDFDSCLSVVRSKRFFWNSNGESINYNYLHRPRRQDFEGALIENGAIYTITKKQYFETRNRLGGKIAFNEMAEESLFEIDEAADFRIIENLLSNQLRKTKQSNKKIKALALDVDGVFTDGHVLFSQDGELAKSFNMKDGMGLENIQQDVEVFIITSENSKLVESRMKKLQQKNVYLGIKDKYLRLEYILQEKGLDRSEVVYVGDDVNDLANLLSCSWGLSPLDSSNEVKQHTDIILPQKGGELAIRNSISFLEKYNQRFK